MNAPAEVERSLVDTNILVYAHDLDEPARHAIALDYQHGREIEGVRFINPFLDDASTNA